MSSEAPARAEIPIIYGWRKLLLLFRRFQDTRCGACERDKSSTMIQMFGQPYNQNTLKSVQPDDQASLNRVKSITSLHLFLITKLCFILVMNHLVSFVAEFLGVSEM